MSVRWWLGVAGSSEDTANTGDPLQCFIWPPFTSCPPRRLQYSKVTAGNTNISMPDIYDMGALRYWQKIYTDLFVHIPPCPACLASCLASRVLYPGNGRVSEMLYSDAYCHLCISLCYILKVFIGMQWYKAVVAISARIYNDMLIQNHRVSPLIPLIFAPDVIPQQLLQLHQLSLRYDSKHVDAIIMYYV